MILRSYQQAAVDETRARYAQGFKAPVLNAPTGSGKTVMASEIIRLAVAKGTRCLFLVPRIELLNQAIQKLAAAGITDIRTIQASNDNGSKDALVTVASIPTLTTDKWLYDLPPADLVIMDECHHGKALTYEALLCRYPQAKKLGLTATVQRGDGRALDNFDCIVTVSSVRELTDLGALVPCKVFAPPRILSTRELAQDPVDAYEQRVHGQKAIVFCSTVETARKVSEQFSERGHPSRWVSGESRDREEIIRSFASDEFRVLVNVSCLIEGFDDPAISAAIFARRFTHVGSYLQACGRIMRPHPSKTIATVVDLCGSALVHGTPDLEREYTLSGKGIQSARQAIRQCQDCGAVYVSADRCSYCGAQSKPLTRAQAKALGIKLDEVTNKHKPTSWPMRAKKRTACASCRAAIEPGTWIVYSKVQHAAMHTSCAARRERSAA